jgi:DNA-directed RNA polymerase specialized sigma24 family protein
MLGFAAPNALRSPGRSRTAAACIFLVAPNGGRYWRYNYRFNGKQKTLALGVYPDVTLAMARSRHQRARQLLADAIDPGAERKTSEKTFEVVARDWHTHWKANRHERHAYYVLRRLEADIFPEFGASRLSDLTTVHFRDAVRNVEQRGALLRSLAPLPREELLALKRTVAELGAVGRNLNQIARAANQGERVDGPGPHEVQLMLRICEALRDHVKALLLANLRSWREGHANSGERHSERRGH